MDFVMFLLALAAVGGFLYWRVEAVRKRVDELLDKF